MTAMNTPSTDSLARSHSPSGTQEIPVWNCCLGDPETLAPVAKHATVTLPGRRVTIPSTECLVTRRFFQGQSKRTTIQSP
jgi:hypothetical protein